MALYIPSPKLRWASIALLVGALGTVLVTLMLYHNSGTIVGEASPTQPIERTDLGTQYAVAKGQQVLRDVMVDNGMSTVTVDRARQLNIEFTPLRLSPDMGEVTLAFLLHISGFVPPDTERALGSQKYELIDKATGKTVWQTEKRGPRSVPENGNLRLETTINGAKKNSSGTRGDTRMIVGRVSNLPAGDYVLKASLTALQFSNPIDDIKLLAKTGVAPEPTLAQIGIPMGLIFLALFLIFVTTPPELRQQKKKPVR